jgi:hypothetical protein
VTNGKGSKRTTVYQRDAGQCHYCGRVVPLDEGTLDHVLPESLGGRDANWNLVWSCAPCNTAKGQRWPTCMCDFCLHAVNEHNHLGLRPSASPAPLTYRIGDVLNIEEAL